jgi:hypothetical protein
MVVPMMPTEWPVWSVTCVSRRPSAAGGWSEPVVSKLRYGAMLTTNTFPFVTIMGVFGRADYPAAAGHRSGR